MASEIVRHLTPGRGGTASQARGIRTRYEPTLRSANLNWRISAASSPCSRGAICGESASCTAELDDWQARIAELQAKFSTARNPRASGRPKRGRGRALHTRRRTARHRGHPIFNRQRT